MAENSKYDILRGYCVLLRVCVYMRALNTVSKIMVSLYYYYCQRFIHSQCRS